MNSFKEQLATDKITENTSLA
jgi:malic enzyme